MLANSCKSADISIVVSAPLWTPPIPPVANTLTPAKSANIIVVATVVAPVNFLDMMKGKSLLDALTTFLFVAKNSISSLVKPTFKTPSNIAIVAGTAPFSLIISSTLLAISTFCGYGIPWDIIVDSKATTGFPSFTAASTSGCICKYFFNIVLTPLLFDLLNPHLNLDWLYFYVIELK